MKNRHAAPHATDGSVIATARTQWSVTAPGQQQRDREHRQHEQPQRAGHLPGEHPLVGSRAVAIPVEHHPGCIGSGGKAALAGRESL